MPSSLLISLHSIKDDWRYISRMIITHSLLCSIVQHHTMLKINFVQLMHIRTAVPFHSKTGTKTESKQHKYTTIYIYTPQLELILELFKEGG